MSSPDALARLKQLLDYVAATERDKLAIPTEVAAEKGFRTTGAELMMLPGVHLNGGADGDPLWVRVERLAKVRPPRLADAELGAWTEVADDPDKKPAIKGEALRAALRAAGLIEEAPADGEPPSFRFEDYPHRDRVKSGHEAWLREMWTPWADEERARRRAIRLYNELFALRTALDGGGDQPVELVCGIGVADWKRPLGRLSYPLLTVQLEIAIDEASHAIELRPRSEAPAGIESDALDKLDVTGVDEWRRFTIAYLEGAEATLSPFAPDVFDPALRKAVQLLDPNGVYLPDLREGQQPDPEALRVGASWLIFSRARRATQVMADLQRLTDAVVALGDGDALPGAVEAIVTGPSESMPDEQVKAFRGVSTVPGVTTSDGTGADLYFPKPFNAEQVEVIQRLESRPGVVVQGPPGTGKTHTIANIVSHYLALGKRVLVTSQKAPALRVLRDKLPTGVRPLAVSLLDSDREGLQQFQDSVDEIAARLQRIKPREAQRHIADLQTRIDLIHAELAGLDRQVDQLGRAGLTPVELDGRRLAPVEAARALSAAGDGALWLHDRLDVIRSHDPGFSDEDVTALREARRKVGERLAYLGAILPVPEELPNADAMAQLHENLSEAEQLEQAIAPPERLADGTTVEALALGEAKLAAAAEARERAQEDGHPWLEQALAILRRGRPEPTLEALEGLRERIDAVCGEGRHFLTLPVTLPDGSDEREFRDPIANLANRGELGIFTSLFARQVKQRIAAVRIAGRTPNGAAEWAEVKRYLEAGDAARELVSIWNHAAAASILAPVSDAGLRSGEAMLAQLDALAHAREAVAREQEAERALSLLLPHWTMPLATGLEQALSVVRGHLRRVRLVEGRRRLAAVQETLADVPGELGDRMRALAHDRVGRIGESTEVVARDWRLAIETLGQLHSLGPAFSVIDSVTAEVRESGASDWARRLREEPVSDVEDPLTPGDWRERWRLRRLATWLDRIDAHDRIRALAAKRTKLEQDLARAYEEVIEARTWCALAEEATDQVRSALTSYAQAMRRIGRGTGVRAARYRQDARAAADRAKNALPCWIMPYYRVSESLPAELGLFDLVIVDEASQSTIAALPALLRAKQVLIVGDDKQVSPDAGFRSEEKLVELSRRYLGDQVEDFRAALREDKSLYDLGSVVFAGGAIMLKEHFRCVAPIIEFSKAQFYDHKLQPLRLPSASERLDPPLVDIFVEDGARSGDVNRAEVACILDEIGRIAADPLMAKRTIGVTTLLGQKQAMLIAEAIEQELGPEIMLRHEIRVGDPSAFQGDERDIMFLSMVVGAKSAAMSGLAFEQRFNVAASRARDRMVLVRSVQPDELSQADKLRRALIQHFRAPFAADTKLNQDRRKRCESPFEAEMFDLLVERGYRVDTQVAVGHKRIDLVVEGGEDRRLAIECDGDAYHGPDRWPEDMARQRMLERAGWTVWRCFASRFVRDREGVLRELIETLDALGILPTSADQAPPSRFAEQRSWRAVYEEEAGDPVPYAWLVPADPFGATLPVAAE
ncbi:AAA family ATPase [Sphingomonas sp. ID1715]|uniref:AAA domain-containing protein n=1 Tax=Sphingomonas sp. ID1715 TaxID=1656898 RepID=UPI00148939FC|nr:AAA domain-containing protein [Sphingomonas sp. ID1715]NNM78623.1 AAA family ATPase [Sphingomonas sp. ID1715]